MGEIVEDYYKPSKPKVPKDHKCFSCSFKGRECKPCTWYNTSNGIICWWCYWKPQVITKIPGQSYEFEWSTP